MKTVTRSTPRAKTHIRSVRVAEIVTQDLDDPVDRHAQAHEEHDSPYEPQEFRASFAGVAEAQDRGVGTEFGGRLPDRGTQPAPVASAASFGTGVVLKRVKIKG